MSLPELSEGLSQSVIRLSLFAVIVLVGTVADATGNCSNLALYQLL